MEINIKATPEEIAELLQAIGSSKEQPSHFKNLEATAPRKFSLEEGYGDKIKNPY